MEENKLCVLMGLSVSFSLFLVAVISKQQVQSVEKGEQLDEPFFFF